MRGRVFLIKVAGAAALLLSAACVGRQDHETVIAECYVGPPTLRLRTDIPLQSAVVATVKHGDRLQVVQRRRRFLRVRAPGGREGWTEENQLLSSAEMGELNELSKRAAALPSQGKGTTYGALNVHTQPQVGAPSFLQIKEEEKFDVLAEVVSPRVPIERPPLIPRADKKQAVPKKPAKAAKIPPPPPPPAPGLPANWLELSKTSLPPDENPADQPEIKPIPTDHWTLVRTASGESGWVLTRRVSMAIPDEVAQYAEGRRIVSYFALGEVQDGDVKKPNWLWTTSGDSHEPYDFDSFRVFIWSLRRHRYETAYIERNLQGYAPVLLKQVQVSTNARGKAATQEYSGFSICTAGSDGQLRRREFALLGNVVRSAGQEGCERQQQVWAAKAGAAPGATPGVASASAANQHPAGPRAAGGLTARLKQQLEALRRWWRKSPPTRTQ